MNFRGQVWKRVGKMACQVWNRVGIWKPGRHTPTKNSEEYTPREILQMSQEKALYN